MTSTDKTVTARLLRESMTDAERLLWFHLRNRRLQGFKFRRQYPIGKYVADFACCEEKLIVEVDGGQHVDNAIQDERRSDELIKLGFRVLRFWNDEVLLNAEDVLEAILAALKQSQPLRAR